MKKRIFWGVIFTMAIVAAYVTLYQPEMLVDPSFSDVSAKSKIVNTSARHIKPVNTSTVVTTNKQQVTPPPSTNKAAPAKTATASTTVVTPAESPAAPSTSSKCYSNCTDPNANYFDGYGNEFDYQGNLIWATCPNVNDPITGQPNPECVCPANNSQGAYYIQGYDKNTNAVVCGFSYYQECPYASAIAASDPECQKLANEQ